MRHLTVKIDLLAVLLIAAFGVGSFVYATGAGDRGLPLDSFLRTANGRPVKVGTLTTSGAGAVNNATTAVPFTINDGKMLQFVCDGSAVVATGAASCGTSVTYTNAAFGTPLTSGEKWNEMLAPNESCAAIATSATANCAVFEMR